MVFKEDYAKYFSIPELDYFLEMAGFEALHYEEWLTGEKRLGEFVVLQNQ